MEGEDDSDYEPIPEELLSPHQRSAPSSPEAASGTPEEPIVLEAEVSAVKLVVPDANDNDDDKSAQEAGFCTRKRMIMGGVLALVLVIVVVIVAVVAGGGGDGGDDGDGADAPAMVAPTVAPTRDPDFCFKTLQEVIPEFKDRGYTRDFSQVFEVEICPNVNIDVAEEELFYPEPWNGEEPPLIAQSNMHVRCGKEAKLTDKCMLEDGNSLMVNTYATLEPGEKVVENVIVEGIVFQRGSLNLLDLRSAGDITFRNCLFRVSVSENRATMLLPDT